MKFKLYHFFLLALAIIAVDQAVKMAVYFNMDYGGYGEIPLLGDWFKLHYTTNPGMAFGFEFGSNYGKIILTLFRLVAMVAIGLYIKKLYQKNAPKGLIICIALILGGAVGNLVDSTFYGFINQDLLKVDNAAFTLFHGKVIDMFYFDLGNVTLPYFGTIHLWPIFNIADAAIFVSVIVIVVRQKAFFPKKAEEEQKVENNSKEQSITEQPVSE